MLLSIDLDANARWILSILIEYCRGALAVSRPHAALSNQDGWFRFARLLITSFQTTTGTEGTMSGAPPREPTGPSPADRKRLALRVVIAVALVLFVLSTGYLLALGKMPPPVIVSSLRLVVGPRPVSRSFPPDQRRSLRGPGGLYPVTSPTNGGQLVSPGVPWAPNTIAEAQAKYPPNAIRMGQNGLVGVRRWIESIERWHGFVRVGSHDGSLLHYTQAQQRKQDNRMQDAVYNRLPVRLMDVMD